MSEFHQPSRGLIITCDGGCGASIEYAYSLSEEWLHIQDEETPEQRFYCPDCKGKADISGDLRMGRFQEACKELIPHLEGWADEYRAIADDFGDWMSEQGIETGALSALWYSTSIAVDLSAALKQVAELDLEDE